MLLSSPDKLVRKWKFSGESLPQVETTDQRPRRRTYGADGAEPASKRARLYQVDLSKPRRIRLSRSDLRFAGSFGEFSMNGRARTFETIICSTELI